MIKDAKGRKWYLRFKQYTNGWRWEAAWLRTILSSTLTSAAPDSGRGASQSEDPKMKFPTLPGSVPGEIDALALFACVLDRELSRVDHKRLSGFCPCLFAADRPACLRRLRFGPIPIYYDADIPKEDRPRYRAPRRQRGGHGADAGSRDDGGGDDGGGDGGPPPPRSRRRSDGGVS
jgi:hypothetical protein